MLTINTGEKLHIAILANLKQNVPVLAGAPSDALAEYDTEETVGAIRAALESRGHIAYYLEANETLLDTLRRHRPDICFNLSEGIRGDAREAQVPAILEMLGIPYTGSRILAQAISLQKAFTKHIWRDAGLPTAPFQMFRHPAEPLRPDLTFPMFVKPVQEGSGMGIDAGSLVEDESALRRRIAWVIQNYRQPALVESYLPGREFTVGLIGNRRRRPGAARWSNLYDARGYHVFPVLEIDVSPVADKAHPYDSTLKLHYALDLTYLCPAPIDEGLAREMQELAVRAFEAIGAVDFSRVDFRLVAEGRPMLMEINTLPGLNPRYSDIVIAASGGGVAYETIVNEIVWLAVERYVEEGTWPASSRPVCLPGLIPTSEFG